MSKELKKIVIGIPHTGIFNWFTVTAILNLRIPTGYAAKYHFIGSSLVYDAREQMVQFARDNKADYILFLDSDMVPPADTIIKLVAVDKDIVTGMAFKRVPPFQPCFYTKCSITKEYKPILESPVEFPDAGLMQIEGCGMACCLIKMHVFDKIEKPYFFPLPNLGEDLTFCLKAKKQRIEMFVDVSIDVGHVTSMPVQKVHFMDSYNNWKNSNPTGTIFKEEK